MRQLVYVTMPIRRFYQMIAWPEQDGKLLIGYG